MTDECEQVITVGEMESSEAIKLLANNIDVVECGVLSVLAKRLGNWPVLLNLANGYLVDRIASGQQLNSATHDCVAPRDPPNAVLSRNVSSAAMPNDAESATWLEPSRGIAK